MELATLVRRLATDWGMSILVIEHDIRFVMSACDSVMALDFGEEIAFGPPEAVRHDPAVVGAYLGDVEQVRPGQGAAAGDTVGSAPGATDLAAARPERTR
jgi:branched-chain amino acid transport system ATP-binding protein